MKNEVNVLHRNYWIGILVAIIICLLTMRYTADTQLKDYVSFAATLASLILAILAIMQAMYSSSTTSNTVAILSESSKKIENNTEDLTKIITSLTSKISDLPKEVEDRINIRLNDLIGNSEQQVFGSNAQVAAQQPEYTQEIDQRYYENYVRLGSVNGLLLLHAIRLSIQTRKSFRLKDLLPDEYIAVNLENMSGYLISHSAAGFVFITQNGELITASNSIIEPRHIDSAITIFISNDVLPALLTYFTIVKTHIDRFFHQS